MFNAENPIHKKVGFYNSCADCAEEKDPVVKPVKAFTAFNKDGDWTGIEIVPAEKFEEYKRVEAMYSESGEVKGTDTDKE
jgi:hypothetical protein